MRAIGQGGKQGQEGPAGPEAQQGDADRHEGKVVPLSHREDPRQGDLEGQGGHGEQENAQIGRQHDEPRFKVTFSQVGHPNLE